MRIPNIISKVVKNIDNLKIETPELSMDALNIIPNICVTEFQDRIEVMVCRAVLIYSNDKMVSVSDFDWKYYKRVPNESCVKTSEKIKGNNSVQHVISQHLPDYPETIVYIVTVNGNNVDPTKDSGIVYVINVDEKVLIDLLYKAI